MMNTPQNHLDNQNNDDVVIRLQNISKKYNLYRSRQDRLKEALHPLRKKYHTEFYALKNINLEVRRGEVLGIVGKNGSGKSTLLKVISNILTPATGTVEVKGKIVPLIELGAGFNPEFTGMENIYFYCALMGFTRKQIDDLIKAIIDFSELGDFIYQPLKTYSSGMKARLAFAVSINVDPDILILDEVLSVGDDLFKRKCYSKMEDFFKGNKTIIFVSHSVAAINQLCTRAVMLDKGECLNSGPAKLITTYYQKLIFSQKDNEQNVRSEINKFMSSWANGEDEKQKGNLIDNETSMDCIDYLPDLIPKSTVEFREYDVSIYDIKILSKKEEPVNILKRNEWYQFAFKVQFNLYAKKVKFAMAIVNQQGLSITNSGDIAHEFPIQINANTGDVFLVKWKFKNILSPNLYYCNAQVSGVINGNNEILTKIHDAILFKVEKEPVTSFGGMVDLGQSIQIEKLSD